MSLQRQKGGAHLFGQGAFIHGFCFLLSIKLGTAIHFKFSSLTRPVRGPEAVAHASILVQAIPHRQKVRAMTLWKPLVSALAGLGLAMVSLNSAMAQNQECWGHPQPTHRFKLAVVPQLPPAEIHAAWSPLLEKIGAQGRWCFQLMVQRSIPEFEVELLEGKPDFAFMNPYHQVMVHRKPGYRPLLADAQLLTGILVVRQGGAIKRLEDLKGQSIAYPAPNAFAATLLTRALLGQKGVATQAVFVKTHSNVYRSVVQGDVAAGGGVNNTLSRELPNLQNELQVLYETPGYRAHPLSAHPRVPVALQTAVRDAFIALAGQTEGLGLLNKAQLPHPQPTDYAKDYLPLEKLGLEAFVQNPK